MSVYLRTDIKKAAYWYRFQIRGRRFHGPTGCTKKADAEAVERRRRAIETDRLSKPQQSLDMIAARWWQEIGEQSRDHDACGLRLERLVKGLGPETMLADISFDQMARYVAQRRQQPTIHGRAPAPATLNREVQLMRRIMRRAVKWGYDIQHIDWGALLGKEPPERTTDIAIETQMAAFDQMPDDWRRLFDFLVATGWRISAACDLRWHHVSQNAIEAPGKGGQTVRALRTQTVNAILDGQRGAHPTYIFAMRPRRTHKERGIYRGIARKIDRHLALNELRRACKLAGIAPFGIHDLRHTAATRYIRATGSLKGAQKLLGHTRITTTGRYAHVTDDDLADGMARVEELTKQRTTEQQESAKILKIKRKPE